MASAPAFAYVDLAPTLGKIAGDAKSIALVEVTAFDPATQTVTVKPVRTIKGDVPAEPITNRVAPPGGVAAPAIRRWAVPGSKGVWFATKTTALINVGTSWYQAKASKDGWKLGVDRPDLPLAFCGRPTHLAEALADMLAGKSAEITVVVYGATDVDTSFDLALGRTDLPGLVRVQRVRASLNMGGAVMAASNSGNYVIGPGPVGVESLPALRQQLKDANPVKRTEAAEAIGQLGRDTLTPADSGDPQFVAITGELNDLIGDASPAVAASASAALVRLLEPGDAFRPASEIADRLKAANKLEAQLKQTDPRIRADAVNAVAMAGAAALDAGLLPAVVDLIDAADEGVRASSLTTLMTLGQAIQEHDNADGGLPKLSMTPGEIKKAVAKLTPMLDDIRWRVEAADALGRLGPKARPAPAKLVAMLNDEQTPVQWAAVRALAQIGGPEARPAVEFIKKKLPDAAEVQQYNMMIYLALLGPEAADAAPVVRSTRIKNPVLPGATLWAIGDTTKLPWQQGGRGFGGPGGPGGGGPGGEGGPAGLNSYMYAAYFRELGPRLRPAAQSLATKLLDGTAGNVPEYGYGLLTADVEGSLAILTPRLADADRAVRQRAAVALGYMGSHARAATPQLETAIATAADEKEARMLKWTLKKVGVGRQ